MIAKVCAYQELRTYTENDSVSFYNFDTDKGMIAECEVESHSKNLIDLIEVGDIAEIEYYVKKYAKRTTRRFEVIKFSNLQFENAHCNFSYNPETRKWTDGKGCNPKIKTILTKEQYEQNCFKV